MEVVIFVDFVVCFYCVCLVVKVGHFCCLFFPMCLFCFNLLFTSETPTFMPGCETKDEFISCIGQIFVVSRASPGVSVAASTAVELNNNIVNVRCWICSPEERGRHHLRGGATQKASLERTFCRRLPPWQKDPLLSGWSPLHVCAESFACGDDENRKGSWP